MPKWLRRTSGTLTLGGGAVGVAAVMMQLTSAQTSGVQLIFFALFLAMSVWGIAAGLLLLEGVKSGPTWSIPYWVIQVPVVSSPWVSYQLSSGGHISTRSVGYLGGRGSANPASAGVGPVDKPNDISKTGCGA